MHRTPIRPALKSIPFPEHATHEAVQADLQALWNVVTSMKKGTFETLDDNDLLPGSEHPDHAATDEEARKIFTQHPTGRSDLAEGQVIQRKLRQLLGFPDAAPRANDHSDDLPLFSATVMPAVVAPHVTAAPEDEDDGFGEERAEAEAEARAEAESELQAEGDADEDDTVQEDAATTGEEKSVPVVLLSSAVTPWQPEHVGAGLLSGLARTMNQGEVMQLILCRVDATTLQVCIETRKIEGEQESVPGMRVTGTPLELDDGLIGAMPVFTQARQTVRDSATAYLQNAANLAAKSKKAAATPAKPVTNTKPSPNQKAKGTTASAARSQPTADAPAVTGVTLKITNADLNPDAIDVKVKSGNTTEHLKASQLTARPYPAGRLTLEVVAEGHRPYYSYPTLENGKVANVNATLVPTQQPDLLSVPTSTAQAAAHAN